MSNIKGSGGSEGGLFQFLLGFCLSIGSVYLFLDSVRVTTYGSGLISGGLHSAWGGHSTTTSMAIIFIPFFLGVIFLFYNSKLKVGWALLGIGLLIIIIEILSRIRFFMNMKTTHFLFFVIMLAAGVGLILRSFKDIKQSSDGNPS